jgi:hypothetical protein
MRGELAEDDAQRTGSRKTERRCAAKAAQAGIARPDSRVESVSVAGSHSAS